MSIEVNEEAPTPRATGKPSVKLTVRLIDEKTGEQTAVTSTEMFENERRLREERKY